MASLSAGFLRMLGRVAAFAAGAVIVMLAACVLAGVVSRLVGEPLIWTDEAARFLMVWLACLGWILAGRHHSHIRIRYFLDKTPLRLRAGLERVMQAAVALFGALTAWYAVDLVARNIEIEATAIPISMSWMYLPLVFAGLATAGQGLADFAAQIRHPGRVALPPRGPMAEEP